MFTIAGFTFFDEVYGETETVFGEGVHLSRTELGGGGIACSNTYGENREFWTCSAFPWTGKTKGYWPRIAMTPLWLAAGAYSIHITIELIGARSFAVYILVQDESPAVKGFLVREGRYSCGEGA